MGKEAIVDARVDGETTHGKVLLETNELLFRGTPRVKVARSDVRAVTSGRGWLRIEHARGVLELALGAQAGAWHKALTEPPKSRLDKIGVKAGAQAKVVVIGLDDAAFEAELEARGAVVGTHRSGAEFVFLAIESTRDLARVPSCKTRLAPKGALWLVWRRGLAELSENDVLRVGRAAGLTDTKVVRFSDTHGALRFVPRKSP